MAELAACRSACAINVSRHEAAYWSAAGLAFDPEIWVGADPHLEVTGHFGRRGLWRSLRDHALARLPAIRTPEIYGNDRNYWHVRITIRGRPYSSVEQGLFGAADTGKVGH